MKKVELTDVEVGVIDVALRRYEMWLKRESKIKRDKQGYSVAVAMATLPEIRSALRKIGTVT